MSALKYFNFNFTVGIENIIVEFQMSLMRVISLLLLVFVGVSFPQNCAVFSLNGFDKCSVCVRSYFPVNGTCVPCPTTQNTINQCSPTTLTATPSSGQANASLTVTNNSTNTPGPSTADNATNTSLISSQTNSSNNSSNPSTPTPNSTNMTTSTSSAGTTSNTVTPPSTSTLPIPDLAQLIFKYLPAHCCEFTVSPVLSCSGCEKDYTLTANKTCDPTTSPSVSTNSPVTNLIPSDLKVSSSLPASIPSLPIVVNQPITPTPPQPIFIPITTPTSNTQPSISKLASKDPNCASQNPNFNPSKPLSADNCRCKCSSHYYFDPVSELCQPMNPLCKTITPQNNCITCYIGYVLIAGNCLISNGQITLTPTPAPQTDPNCQVYQPNTTNCLTCVNRFYFNSDQGRCLAVDSVCQTWNSVNGYCTSCNSGFKLGNNTCKPVPASPAPPQDYSRNCLKKSSNGKCSVCPYRSFLTNGLCLPVSDLCLTYNAKFGYCLTCYGGYELNDGVCTQAIPNCAAYSNSECSTCTDGYFVSGGECQPVNLLCNGYDPQNGFCLDCIYPYTLDPSSGQCLYYPS